MRTTHAAEMCGLGSFLRKRFVLTSEIQSALTNCVIPLLRAGMSFSQVSSMRS